MRALISYYFFAMLDKRNILSWVLRAAICLHLGGQMLAALGLIGMFWFASGLALDYTVHSPTYAWLWFVLFGYFFVSSAILLHRLTSQVISRRWRYVVILLSLANVSIFAIPVLRLYYAFMEWQLWLYFGIPFLMNALVLGVVLSRRLYAYIFPPKA